MKHIGYILLFVSAFCLIGTIGSMEHGGLTLVDGILRSIVCIALMIAGANTVQKYEEE